jgi:hypothetical protein
MLLGTVAEPPPDPQRESIDVAFGVHVGPAPDRLLGGVAVLGLLTRLAVERPLPSSMTRSGWIEPPPTRLRSSCCGCATGMHTRRPASSGSVTSRSRLDERFSAVRATVLWCWQRGRPIDLEL